MKTILVTGANGQLGNEMRIVAKDSNDHYIFTDVNQVEGVETTYLDITDLDAVRKMVADNGVNVVVNCAAYTNVDAAESNEVLAERLNAEAPENLAKAMKAVDGLLIQLVQILSRSRRNVKELPALLVDIALKGLYVGVARFEHIALVCRYYLRP